MPESKYRPASKRRGIALCLSGGGFRAALYHAGAIRRLRELGVLPRLTMISSVSGGSILNGLLAAQWRTLAAADFANLDELVLRPLEAFCAKDLRTEILLWDRINPRVLASLMRYDTTIANRFAEAYASSLGLGVPLDSIPEAPEFVFCATNLETGVNWIFTRERMGDYLAGYAPPGRVTVAEAVAASAAFPVAIPPFVLVTDGRFTRGRKKYSRQSLKTIPLTDGGVYDNLGLEPAWKSQKLLLVSDGGHPLLFADDPSLNIVSRLSRCSDVTMNQCGALRKRWLISSFQEHILDGTYWGIGGEYTEYPAKNAKGYEADVVELFKDVRTDLDAFTAGEIACLENHGYALADAGVRGWLSEQLPLVDAPFAWPWPDYASGAAATEAISTSNERGVLGDIWASVQAKFTSLFK